MAMKWFYVLMLLGLSATALDDNLKIAAFNVRQFGVAKMKKADVGARIATILLRYDLALIQEVRDKSGRAIRLLIDGMNTESGGKYGLLLSDRSGRSKSKEQYAYIYRIDRLAPSGNYNYDDGSEESGTDTFEREPYVVNWRVLGLNTTKKFITIAIHTTPKKAVDEIDKLVDVYDNARGYFSEKNAIIMGDFNAACRYVSKSKWSKIRLKTQRKFQWIIKDDADTTTTTTDCAYDRFVLVGKRIKKDFVNGSESVFHFEKSLNLSKSQMLAVSDHYPIEMELRV